MTRVDFYRVPGDLDTAIDLSNELLATAFRAGLDVLVHCSTGIDYSNIVHRVINYCDTRLIPCSEDIASRHPVTVSHTNAPGHHLGLLINFGLAVPRWYGRFEKLAEIIYDDHQIREGRRQNYRFFRDRGYPLRFNDLVQGAPGVRTG